jgi:hypothetical protein
MVQHLWIVEQLQFALHAQGLLRYRKLLAELRRCLAERDRPAADRDRLDDFCARLHTHQVPRLLVRAWWSNLRCAHLAWARDGHSAGTAAEKKKGQRA